MCSFPRLPSPPAATRHSTRRQATEKNRASSKKLSCARDPANLIRLLLPPAPLNKSTTSSVWSLPSNRKEPPQPHRRLPFSINPALLLRHNTQNTRTLHIPKFSAFSRLVLFRTRISPSPHPQQRIDCVTTNKSVHPSRASPTCLTLPITTTMSSRPLRLSLTALVCRTQRLP